MAWIESHESLPSHPKTKRMCRLLKINPITAVGHLHFLWWWAMNHAQDGVLDRYSKEDIADACEWIDDAEAYFNALVESGFIDLTETGSVIHNWFDYAGKLIALRQKDAERKRNARGKQEDSKGHPTDIQRTSEGHLTESIRDLDLDLNLDLNKEKDTHSLKDDFDKVSKAYGQIHTAMGLPYTNSQLLTKMLDEGIPPEHIIGVMKEKYRDGVTTLKFYEGAIRDSWFIPNHGPKLVTSYTPPPKKTGIPDMTETQAHLDEMTRLQEAKRKRIAERGIS